MAWFPWVAMPVRPQSAGELIDWLRYSAIDFGAPPQFIDSIDGLRDLVGVGKEIEELGDEITAVEEQRDALKEALKELIEKLEDEDSPVVKEQALDHARTVLDELPCTAP
jgi:predicted transcriptional regulator